MQHTKLCVSRNDETITYPCEPGQKPDPDSVASGEFVSVVVDSGEDGAEITHLMPREVFDRLYKIEVEGASNE